MDYELFEPYGLSPEDIRADVYDINQGNDADYRKHGVKISITNYYDIAVSCHSENSQIKNRDKCVEYLLLILEHIWKESEN